MTKSDTPRHPIVQQWIDEYMSAEDTIIALERELAALRAENENLKLSADDANLSCIAAQEELGLLREARELLHSVMWNNGNGNPVCMKIDAHLPQPSAGAERVADGSLTADEAVARVLQLFPGADKLALDTLARALGRPSPEICKNQNPRRDRREAK